MALSGWNVGHDATMPDLVDPSSFSGGQYIPPPPGATQGGEPTGFPGAFPGVSPYPSVHQQHLPSGAASGGWGASAGNTPWNRMATMSPSFGSGTQLNQAAPPNSAPAAGSSGWAYGQFPPPGGSTPLWNTPAPTWSNTPRSNSIGPQTPASPFPGRGWQTPASQTPQWNGNNGGWGDSMEQPLPGGAWFGRENKSNPSTPNHGAWFAGDAAGSSESSSWSSAFPRMHRRSSSKRNGRQRSASLGGPGISSSHSWLGNPEEPHPRREVLSEANLARRPRDWRADYNPRGGISMLSMVGAKNRSDVREMTADSIKRLLHPLVSYNAVRCPIDYDLRDNPLENERLFPSLGRPFNTIDVAQLATSPPTSTMRLYHSRLPWYIDIYQSHPNGVTIYDLLTQMYDCLAGKEGMVVDRHYYNEDLTLKDREALSAAYQKRCEGDVELLGEGLRKVDFLGMEERLLFLGLVRGKNGMWEMKLKKLNNQPD